jgi:lysophospholipase L1-like esterase
VFLIASACVATKKLTGSERHRSEFVLFGAVYCTNLARSPKGRAEQFAGGVEKTKALPVYFEAIAKAAGAEFFGASKLTTADGINGVHLSPEAHKAIGTGVAEKVKAILQ